MKLTAVDQTGMAKSQFYKKSSSRNSEAQSTASTQKTQSTQNTDAKQETFNMNMDANQEQSGSDLDNSFKFNFNISEKSANGQGKCDPSYTEDGNEKEKGELSESENSKLETSDSGASHVNNGSFSKWRKLIMPLDFSLILKVKHEYFCPGPGVIIFFSCLTRLSMKLSCS